jgi:Fanconi anemia group M protein
VDYVIFYEPVPSGIRDIQRAGRTGRQEEGTVYVLIAEDTRDEGHFWSAHHKKKNMNKVLNELKNENTMENKNKEGQKTLDGFNKSEDKEDEIIVIADDRENSVAKKLSKMDITVRKNRLDVADFLVSERTAVERKSASDFVDSLVDQRLFSQMPDLQQFENPVIIIEGDDLYSHRQIHPNAIRGALASIAIDHGIPILWTDNEENTADMLETLAKREQEENDRTVSIRGTRSIKSEKELQQFVVAGLPDVNTKLAERLLEELGSIQAVFTASNSELMEVEGIGEKTADNIRTLIQRDYNEE